MARPTIFSANIGLAIVAAKRNGGTHEQVASVAGVSVSSLRGWLRRGDRGEAPFDAFSEAFYAADHRCTRSNIDALAAQLRQTMVA